MSQTIRSILAAKGQHIWRLSPVATVYEAIELMSDKGVGAVLVTSEAILIGIVTERDYARKVILQCRSSKETQLWQIMSRGVITTTLAHTVEDCMRIMTNCHIRHLPVLDGPKLVGVVSIGDLVKAVISDQAEVIDQLHSYIGGGSYPL